MQQRVHKKKISESNIENRNLLVNNNKFLLHVSRPSEGSFAKKEKPNINHTLLQINPLKLNLNKNFKASSKNNTDRNEKDIMLSMRGNRSIDFQAKEKQNLDEKRLIFLNDSNKKQKPGKTYAEIQREKNHLRSSSKNLESMSSQQYLKHIFLSDQKSTSNLLNFDSNFNFENQQSQLHINGFNIEDDLPEQTKHHTSKCCKNQSILKEIVSKINETTNIQAQITNEKIITQLKDRIIWLQQQLKQKSTKYESLQTKLSESEMQITLKNKQIDLYKTTIQRYSQDKLKLQQSLQKVQSESKSSSQKAFEYEIKHKVILEKVNQDFQQQLGNVNSELLNIKQSHKVLEKQIQNAKKQISTLRKENMLLRKQMNKYKILSEDISKKLNESDKDIQNSNLKLLKTFENQLQQLKCNNPSKKQEFEIVRELTILLQNTQKELNITKKAKNSFEMKIQFSDRTHTSQIQWLKQNYIREIKGLKEKLQNLSKQNNDLKKQHVSTISESQVVVNSVTDQIETQ